jgi:bifunctional DNase/RNase
MEKEKEARVEVKVNFLSIDRGTGAPIVVLKEKEGDSNRILLIWIGESEAAAIQMHIEKMQLPRPMTHDLLKSMIETLGAKVTAVCVHSFEERTFYAHVTLEVNGDNIDVDCRPSDAIAIALRCEVPIYIVEEVLSEQGYSEQELDKGQKPDTKDVLQNLDDDTLKQYTV